MTCDECRGLMQDLIDAELSGAECSVLEAHMIKCVECARMHRHLAKFTTTMVKTLQPLRTSEDFMGKVMARFEDSKVELLRVRESQKKTPVVGKTWPVWPFTAGIGVLIFVALYLLFSGGTPAAVAALTKGHGSVRIMAWNGKDWQEVNGARHVNDGQRVEAVEAPGETVELDCGSEVGLKITLRAPCKVHVERTARQILLKPLSDAPGRFFLRVVRTGRTEFALKSVQLEFNLAKVQVDLAEESAVDVEPHSTGSVTVSVQKGAALIFNNSAPESVAEGFARNVPQSGACTPAVQAKPEAFMWIEK